jgi:hypothetical protein
MRLRAMRNADYDTLTNMALYAEDDRRASKASLIWADVSFSREFFSGVEFSIRRVSICEPSSTICTDERRLHVPTAEN